MQRCRAAPGKTSRIARLGPSRASLVTQITPSTPRARSDSGNDFQPPWDSASMASSPRRRLYPPEPAPMAVTSAADRTRPASLHLM